MRKHLKITTVIILAFFAMRANAFNGIAAKDTIEQKLSLDDVVSMAIEQSPAVKNAQNVVPHSKTSTTGQRIAQSVQNAVKQEMLNTLGKETAKNAQNATLPEKINIRW